MATPTPAQQDAIPSELRARAQWVGRRADKAPVNAATGLLASSTDSLTWATFDAALAAVERYQLAGLGFVFSSGDPYTGIDLDHCFDEHGQLWPWAAEVVQSFAGAYIECSPSGSGLHIICRGKPSWQGKRPMGEGGQKLEVYATARFFTVTGDVYGGER